MYISELGKSAGATPKAIRLYEDMGLLGTVRRRGAYRIYAEHHVGLVRLIRQAQSLGFRLAEVAALMGTDGTGPDWSDLLDCLERKRLQNCQEMTRLQQLDLQLAQAIAEIGACDAIGRGPAHLQCDLTSA